MARREALDNPCRSAICTRRRGKPTRSSRAAVNVYRARMIVSATPQADSSWNTSKLTPSIVEGRESCCSIPTLPVLGRARVVAWNQRHVDSRPRHLPGRPRENRLRYPDQLDYDIGDLVTCRAIERPTVASPNPLRPAHLVCRLPS
jgi:hypothetical protein